MHKKILTILLLIICSVAILNINKVFGVDIISQCWNYHLDNDDKGELIFRLFTTPHSTTKENYHYTNSSDYIDGGKWHYTFDGNSYTSKWIYALNSSINFNTAYAFLTIGFAFHTEKMGDYSIKGDNYMGYYQSKVLLSDEMFNLKEAIEGATSSYTTPGIAKKYSDVVFYEAERMKLNREVVNWGTGLKVQKLQLVRNTEYRYGIVNIKGNNVYVYDNVIFGDDVVGFVKEAKLRGKTDSCYISNIIVSKTFHSSGGFEVSQTAHDFANQYDKQQITFFSNYSNKYVTTPFWSLESLGRERPSNNAMGSVMNLYDNELNFPQMSNRTVVVRHINIGSNTTISEEIIKAGTPIESNNITLKATLNKTERTVTGEATTDNPELLGYQEYYEGLLDMEEMVTKRSLEDTTHYRCIGHNIAISTDFGTAKSSIDTAISNGRFNPSTAAIGAAKEANSDSDYIVIDFYYTEYEKEVEVNHIYVDKNGYVIEADRQTIIPNETAISNNETIYRTNTDKYVRETYSKKLGHDVITRIADSLKDDIVADDVDYKGHKVYQQKVSLASLIGKHVGTLNSNTTASITSKDAQVNFYYYVENKIEENEPEKDIDGKVFVNTDEEKNEISTDCLDVTDNIDIVSIPSGSYAKVGITGLPRAMVGAITAKYVPPSAAEYGIDLDFKFAMAGKTKTYKIEDLKYRVGYYKITDMAIYKLINTIVYDAQNGKNGTVGSSIFNWKNGKLETIPESIDVDVKLTGINGKTIANTDAAINNINNYVKILLKDKNGLTYEGTSFSYSKVYLTQDQYDAVNGCEDVDGPINADDKTCADNKLANFKQIWEDKKAIQDEKQEIYNVYKAERDALQTAYNAAKKELDTRQAAYTKAANEKVRQENAIAKAKSDLETLLNTTIPNMETELETMQNVDLPKLKSELAALESELMQLQSELSELQSELTTLQSQLGALETELATLEAQLSTLESELTTLQNNLKTLNNNKSSMLSAKENAQANVQTITKQLEEANKAYLAAVEERERLKNAANCNDTVDDEVYIYLEQAEKDALEQCRQNKEAYNQNLQNRVVENAKAEYDNLQSTLTQAQQTLRNAEAAYNSLINNIALTEENITKKQSDIKTKQGEVEAKELEVASKNGEIVAKQTEVNNKQKQVDEKQAEVDAKSTEIVTMEAAIETKKADIVTGRENVNQLEVTIGIMERTLEEHINNEYLPKKQAYESYRDNEYKIANDELQAHKDAKYVENALTALNTAKSETNKAKSDHDKYHRYWDNLYDKYDEYKAKYDEYESITEKNAATIHGLKLQISVQNMIVKLNGEELATASSNTASGTFDVQQMMNNREKIPQVKTERPVISKEVYSNIGTTKTTEEDYNNSNYIAKEKTNGIRALAGEAKYEAQVVIGQKEADKIEDTIYYSDQSSDEGTVIFKLKTTELSEMFKFDTTATTAEEKYEHTTPINIYTPITVSAKLETNTNQIVNQTQNEELHDSMIQLNTAFTINLANNAVSPEYNIENTNKYSGGYYVKFDFDVHNVSVNGSKYNNGNRISAGTWIGLIPKKNGKAYITAQAYGNIGDTGLDMVSEDNSSYTVRAVAYNVTELMLNRSIRFESLKKMIEDTSDLKEQVFNICINPSYFAEETYDVIIINRAFDFKVTDLKDVNWKSVFRKTATSNTNAHRGIVYHAGSTKWNTNTDKSNDIVHRTSSEIGRSPTRILPLGPYKNTNTTYIKAPKMGYRFSFDFKVTGSYYDSEGNVRDYKKAYIATKFYYISKDGKKYLKEYDGKSEGIYLFYRTSDGRYVRIDENGGNYNLTFTPNDGYRYVQDTDTFTLSKKAVSLGNLRNLTLTHEMATVAPNGAIITYYGEYKLPNSTIAVEVDKNGTYNINEPLQDGYIGVVFDIVAYAGKAKIEDKIEEIELSYSKNTKENKPNTSQWDYEGFLGYTNYGEYVPEDNPIKLKLEEGTWLINDEVYNEIKGSVMLYDLDERAAADYE